MRLGDIYAVITGDVIGSSRLQGSEMDSLLSALESSFKTIEDVLPGATQTPFTRYRGDSFQGVLSKAELALRAIIIIRAGMHYGLARKQRRYALDARIAVGIGAIEFLPGGRVSEGRGRAFELSGRNLDQLKKEKERRLVIETPWPEINEELAVQCALLDALIYRWSANQAKAVVAKLRGLTQQEAAREFGISQPSVGERLRDGGAWAVERLYLRYERLIHAKIGSGAYNEPK